MKTDKIWSLIDKLGDKVNKIIKTLLNKVKIGINKLNEKVQKLNTNNDSEEKAKKSNRKTGIASAICISLAILLLCNSLFFPSRGYKKTLDIAMDIYSCKIDGEEYLDLMPEEIVEQIEYEYLEENNYLNSYDVRKKIISEFEIDRRKEKNKLDKEYGIGWTYTYEITFEHDYTTEEIENSFNRVAPYLDGKITDAKSVDTYITIKNKGEIIDERNGYATLYKYKGKWYLYL